VINLSDGHAQKGGRDVGTIIDVLGEERTFARRAATIAHETDRVHVEQQRGCAALGRRFRIKNVSRAKRQGKALNFAWVLL
jgi:hypothetical protein